MEPPVGGARTEVRNPGRSGGPVRPSRSRVVVAEDDPMLRQLIQDILAREPDIQIVQSVGAVDDILPAIEGNAVDLLLLDLNLRGQSGLQALPQIRRRCESVAVMVLTGEEDVDIELQVARHGAYGFIHKTAPPGVLANAIRSVAAGGVWFSSAALRSLLNELVTLRVEQNRESRPEERLSLRERQVLSYIEDGLTNGAIASRIYVSLGTVKGDVRSILGKLGVATRGEAVEVARREGLLANVRQS